MPTIEEAAKKIANGVNFRIDGRLVFEGVEDIFAQAILEEAAKQAAAQKPEKVKVDKRIQTHKEKQT